MQGVPVSIKRPNDAATLLHLESFKVKTGEESRASCAHWKVSPMGMIGGVPVGMQMPGGHGG